MVLKTIDWAGIAKSRQCEMVKRITRIMQKEEMEKITVLKYLVILMRCLREI